MPSCAVAASSLGVSDSWQSDPPVPGSPVPGVSEAMPDEFPSADQFPQAPQTSSAPMGPSTNGCQTPIGVALGRTRAP